MKYTRSAFTLVELLVVIAIISVLAAMLLPTIEASIDQARRISCLNDHKQLGILTTEFAHEHNDRVPHPYHQTEHRLLHEMSAKYDTATTLQTGYSPTVSVYDGGGTGYMTTPLGTLVQLGYIEQPELLLCPDHPRLHWHSNYKPGGTFWANWHYEDAPYRSNWKAYALAGQSSRVTMMNAFTDLKRGNSPEHSYRDVTLQFIADYWNRSCKELRLGGTQYYDRKDQVGPMLYACLNADGWYWGSAHKSAGVNAVFYDGGARWVSREETSGKLSNSYPLLGPLQMWQRTMTER